MARGVARSSAALRGRYLPDDRTAIEALLRSIFIPHLVRLSEEGVNLRRIGRLARIPANAHPLVGILVEQRLLLADQRSDGTTQEQTVEIAHEALLREWPLLAGWLQAEREFLRWLAQLDYTVEEYEALPPNKKADMLLTGFPLLRARDYLAKRKADLQPSQLDFLAASVDRDNALIARQRFRSRSITAVFVTMGLIGVGLLTPTLLNAFRAWYFGVPYDQVSRRLAQYELWMKNFDCDIAYKRVTTPIDGDANKTTDIGICPKTGDISMKVTRADGAASYQWFKLDDFSFSKAAKGK